MHVIKFSKGILYVSLLIIISILFLIPLFHPGFYQTQDAEGHIARFAAYFKAFSDGQIPPRWAGTFNFGFGTPVLIFYYPLPGYLASFLHFLRIHYELIFKLFMISGFMVAPLGFYAWMSLLFRKEVAFVSAVFYGFAPYHFLDLYVRADVAEILAFVFIPLVFYAIEKYLLLSVQSKISDSKRTNKNYQKSKRSKKILPLSLSERVGVRGVTLIIIGGVFYALLVLSHNGVSLMFSPIFFLYMLLRIRSVKLFLSVCSLFTLGLVLSAFFWIPALYESKFTYTLLLIGDMYKQHFPNISQLIYSPWGFGTYVNRPGGLSPQIGILNIGLVILGVTMISIGFWRRRRSSREMLFWLIIFIIGMFITLPLSSYFWGKLPMLRLFEFPWRFTALSSFSAAVLAGYVLSYIQNNKIIFCICFILLLYSIQFVRIKGYTPGEADSSYEQFRGTTSYHGEGRPIWVEGDEYRFPKSPIELIGGRGDIIAYKRKTGQHTFQMNAETQAALLDNTVYFPGWHVQVDGQQTPIQFQDPNHRGLITFQVRKGHHVIDVRFIETADRLLADGLSLLGLGVIILFGVFSLFIPFSVERVSKRG